MTFEELLDAAKKAPHQIAQDGLFRINVVPRSDGSTHAHCFIHGRRVTPAVLEVAMAAAKAPNENLPRRHRAN
jgi:hypothetical protein